MKSGTIKSYISAIRTTLQEINIPLKEDKFLLKSLTKACTLQNDQLLMRFVIRKQLLMILIKKTGEFYQTHCQPYLGHLYQALFSTAYFGLFRVGELTKSPHVLLARDVHIACNKKKMLFILHSSKTHGKDVLPQTIKITSQDIGKQKQSSNNIPTAQAYCPYALLRKYITV